MDNASIVTTFSLLGLNGTVNYRATLFCLTVLCYCVILLVNIVLAGTIIWDKNLHEPMYILLCNFCINGLCGTTGFYPKFLSGLLSAFYDISYKACLFQAFVLNSCPATDLSILAVMAYDRYVAICRPLVYHSVMTKQRVSQLVSLSWLLPLSVIATNLLLTSTLRLCGSDIDRLYCVNWVIVKLACHSADTISSRIIANITLLFYVGHGFLILWSYMYMIRTCVRSTEDRRKFMQTCLPHFISLISFLLAQGIDLRYVRVGSKDISQRLQNFLSMEFLLIPPVMNPFIYGFKLTKVRKRLLDIFVVKRK